jgi:shikimate dehydrogenase
MGTKHLLGILGYPLGHSYSPAMHNAGIRSLGIDYEYLPFEVDAQGLAGKIAELRKNPDFAGANVTLPHKQTVIPLLDELSDLSAKMGVVNTIVHRDGKLYGTTTDPEGFLNGFKDAGHSFDGKSVVVLGSGGTARTIAFALLLLENPSRVALAARNARTSRELADEILAKTGKRLEILPSDSWRTQVSGFDVVVNATPIGMHPNVEQSPLDPGALREGQIVYDVLYNPEETALLKHARERHCETVGGLGMLVHQGIASLKLWTGLDPTPESYYAGIRARQAADAGTHA